MNRLGRTAPLLVVLGTAMALVASAQGMRQPRPSLTCHVGGRTTVTGIPPTVSHLRFRWRYAGGSTHTSGWIAPAPDGTAWIPTWRHATRATADLHFRGRWNPYHDGRVLEVSARCR